MAFRDNGQFDFNFGPFRKSDILTPEEFAFLVSSFDGMEWTYAKTMPWVPHFYSTLKRFPGGRDEWMRIVWTIWERGFDEMYGKRRFRAVAVNGWKYWTYSSPIAETDLINRKVWPTTSTVRGAQT